MLQAESASDRLILQAAATAGVSVSGPVRAKQADLDFTASLVKICPSISDSHRDDFTRRLYIQAFGFVYLIAFASLWSQIHGLVGQQGLLPADAFFKAASDKLGGDAYRLLPSVCWLGSNDLMLHLWCASGIGLSILLIAGFAPRLVLVALWGIYLSLCIAGQAFLSFQWDALLLEMTVCSLLYAPRGWRVDWRQASPMLPAARWLLWGLAFKLMFLSGVTKLLSGDAAWNDGTALRFHYYTQPIPNWISWYAYQLPLTYHQVPLMLMFVVELILPFLIFTGRRGRVLFGVSTIVLMLAIEATGNFGFFNLQTIVLCLPLLNDHVLHRLIRWRSTSVGSIALHVTRPQWRTGIGTTAAVTLLALSSLTIIREMVRTQQVDKMPPTVVSTLDLANRWLLSWAEPALLNPIAPYRTINGYGLFRVMTTRRPEIVVEISDDGRTWDACEFSYKPGDINRAPPIVAPYMPRLDWQMWFAALDPKGSGYWLAALTEKLLEGNPSVARLIGNPKLGRDPPRFVRLTYYEYKFSSADQRNATGAWWSRSYSGQLTGELTRKRD
jgi:hypothetical protein